MKAKNPRGIILLGIHPGMTAGYYSRRSQAVMVGKVQYVRIYQDYSGRLRTKVRLLVKKDERGYYSSYGVSWVDYGSLLLPREGEQDLSLRSSWREAPVEDEEKVRRDYGIV